MFEEFFREWFLTVVSASCCVCMGVKGEGRLWCAAGVLTQHVSFSFLSLEYNLQPWLLCIRVSRELLCSVLISVFSDFPSSLGIHSESPYSVSELESFLFNKIAVGNNNRYLASF